MRNFELVGNVKLNEYTLSNEYYVETGKTSGYLVAQSGVFNSAFKKLY